MPLPKPGPTESKDDFIDRCMSDEIMMDEFENEKQRLAICNDLWTNKRAVIPYKDYGIADVNTKWDAGKEKKKAEPEDLIKICTWYDEENKDNKGAYKLPHHRVSDYRAIWSGVKSAMGVLFGAMGGADIPESDRKRVFDHLAKHYKQFDKEPPEYKELNMRKESEKEEMVCCTREGQGYERRYYKASEMRVAGTENEPIIEGHAAVFNKFSLDLGGFKEKIAKGAFSKTLADKADVRGLFNHDSNFILGRTKNGTLELWEDDVGLGYRLSVDPEITYVKNLIRSIKRGDITQNSFGFRVIKDRWNKDLNRRILEEVELFDISPVTFPAYPQTKVKVRALEELKIAGIDVERVNTVIARKDNKSKTDEDEIRTTINILFKNHNSEEEMRKTIDLLTSCLTDEPLTEQHTDEVKEPINEPLSETEHSEIGDSEDVLEHSEEQMNFKTLEILKAKREKKKLIFERSLS